MDNSWLPNNAIFSLKVASQCCLYVAKLLKSPLWISSSIRYWPFGKLSVVATLQAKRVANSYVSVSIATKWGHYSLTCFEENILKQTIFVTQSWYIPTMRFTLLVFQVVLLNTYGLKRELSCFPVTWLAKESSRMSHFCSVDNEIIFIYWCQRKKKPPEKNLQMIRNQETNVSTKGSLWNWLLEPLNARFQWTLDFVYCVR